MSHTLVNSTCAYIRSVVVTQARREIKEAKSQTISPSAEDQLAFTNLAAIAALSLAFE
jgi:hypothetical protein